MQLPTFESMRELAVTVYDDFQGNNVRSKQFSLFVLDKLARITKKELGNVFMDAALFGSYARGDHDQDSDIDICLILDCEQEEIYSTYRYQTSDEKFNLVYQYGVNIDLIHITNTELHNPTRTITRLIKKEGVFWSKLEKN